MAFGGVDASFVAGPNLVGHNGVGALAPCCCYRGSVRPSFRTNSRLRLTMAERVPAIEVAGDGGRDDRRALLVTDAGTAIRDVIKFYPPRPIPAVARCIIANRRLSKRRTRPGDHAKCCGPARRHAELRLTTCRCLMDSKSQSKSCPIALRGQ